MSSVKLVQKQHFTVYMDDKELGSINQSEHLKTWDALAFTKEGQVHYLKNGLKRAEAIDLVLKWHGYI